MSREKLLLNTVFIQALRNQRDQYHLQAKAVLPRVRAATEVWVTEVVLIEVGNDMSAVERLSAVQFIHQYYVAANVPIVSVDTSLLNRGLNLEGRGDQICEFVVFKSKNGSKNKA